MIIYMKIIYIEQIEQSIDSLDIRLFRTNVTINNYETIITE